MEKWLFLFDGLSFKLSMNAKSESQASTTVDNKKASISFDDTFPILWKDDSKDDDDAIAEYMACVFARSPLEFILRKGEIPFDLILSVVIIPLLPFVAAECMVSAPSMTEFAAVIDATNVELSFVHTFSGAGT